MMKTIPNAEYDKLLTSKELEKLSMELLVSSPYAHYFLDMMKKYEATMSGGNIIYDGCNVGNAYTFDFGLLEFVLKHYINEETGKAKNIVCSIIIYNYDGEIEKQHHIGVENAFDCFALALKMYETYA